MSEVIVTTKAEIASILRTELESVLKDLKLGQLEVKQTYTTQEAVEYLGISKTQLIIKKRLHGIQGVRYGRQNEYTKDQLDELKRRMREEKA